MHKSIHNLASINDQIKLKFGSVSNLEIIAVSKTFSMSEINPLIENGHLHFGENKVQEAVDKWTVIKKSHESLKLHMIGKLQTNKVKLALRIFDYIHSLDNEKLAIKISDEQKKQRKKPKIFIQVNIGNEEQKSGISKEKLSEFYTFCSSLNLEIIGTMCIPPNDSNTETFFSEMNKINKDLKFKDLSMGMSGDYLNAIKNSSTYVRIGSKIFGSRD